LGLEKADEDELYEAMDWLVSKQELIENELANRHLSEGALVLYDVSSTYFEGTQCPLARSGYNRDKKKGFLQIVFGLICDKRGCPIAVEVFEGNTSDTTTITAQIEKVRHLSNKLFAVIRLSRKKVRPIYHRLEQRVKAHVFLCMLAYYVEWHMRKSFSDASV
jgi:transposase